MPLHDPCQTTKWWPSSVMALNPEFPLIARNILERCLLLNPPEDGPLTMFAPRLHEILYRAGKIEKGEKIPIWDRLFNTLWVDAVQEDASCIGEIPFDLGEYELSDKGKRILEDDIFQKLITIKDQQISQFPEKSIGMTITVACYTDEEKLKEGTDLFNELTQGIQEQIPQSEIERRKFLNQRLSEFRTLAVNEFMVQLIESITSENPQIQFNQRIVGYGEELPSDISPPYDVRDSRRRICKVYNSIKIW